MCWCYIVLALIIIIYLCRPIPKILNPRTVHLFFTGGFDSTFRLCQIVLMENRPVQPIYLDFPELDGFSRRKNVKYEFQSMKKTINELKRRGYGHLIYPLKVVTKIELTDTVLDAMRYFYKKKKVSRVISQYAYMIQYSLSQNLIIEECAENSTHSTSYNLVGKHLNKDGMLNLYQVAGTPLMVIRNLRFSTIHLTKKDMLNIAKQNNFDNILAWTKSCWYPKKNGNPCGKCSMCKDRVIIEYFTPLEI